MTQVEHITSIKDPPNYIRATLGREVGVTSLLIEQAFDVHLKRVTDLTSTQVVLLMILKCDQVMSLEQVSKDTSTFGAERTALLEQLFQKRYIRYQSSAEQSIALTEEGERATINSREAPQALRSQ